VILAHFVDSRRKWHYDLILHEVQTLFALARHLIEDIELWTDEEIADVPKLFIDQILQISSELLIQEGVVELVFRIHHFQEL